MVPLQAVVEVAEIAWNLPPAEVQDTLALLRVLQARTPPGGEDHRVCRSISCARRGGDEVLEHMCHKAGTQPGENLGRRQADARSSAECPGACDFAPCMLAGDELVKDMTMESAEVCRQPRIESLTIDKKMAPLLACPAVLTE